MNILVYSEDTEIALRALGKGRELADDLDAELNVLAVNKNPEAFLKHGADNVYIYNNDKMIQFHLEPYTHVILEMIKETSPWLVIIGATKRGKEFAPQVAASIDAGCMNDCLELDIGEEGHLIAERLAYGGSVIAKEIVKKSPAVVTIAPRAFQKPEPIVSKGKIIDLEVEAPQPRIKVVEKREKPKKGADLENAKVIVSAGRGFREKEDLELIEELADVLDAEIGCSRPISADLGWLDEWVGISGKKVKPNLYVACGISGTIQHAAGIRDSQIIVSINKDESANIHRLSDYSIVGDIYEVIPTLLKALKEAS